MDMLKVLKIRSLENAVYTPQYNRMRFKIPADNLNTHLNESYLSFQVVPVDSISDEPLPSSVNVGFGNDDKVYYPTCLLKTVRLFRGDSNIPLEEIQHFNILDQTMKIYEKDVEGLVSDQYESGFYVSDTNQGTWSSLYLNGSSDVHIYLKDIFGLCKNKDFYLSDTQGLQIEFELEDRYKLFDTFPSNDPEGIVNLPSAVSAILVDPTVSNFLRDAYYPTTSVQQQSFASNTGEIVVGRPLENTTGSQAQQGRGYGGGGKASGTKAELSLKPFYFRLDEDTPLVFDTYDDDDYSFSVVSAVANTLTLIPKWDNDGTNKYTGMTAIVSEDQSNTILTSAILQQNPGSILYYKTSPTQVGMNSIGIYNLSYTDFQAPNTKATLSFTIQQESGTAPTNWIPYAISLSQAPSTRATNTGIIKINDNVPESTGWSANVPKNLYRLSSVKDMGYLSQAITVNNTTNELTFSQLESELVIGNRYIMSYQIKGYQNGTGAYTFQDFPLSSVNNDIWDVTEESTVFVATAVDTLQLVDEQLDIVDTNIFTSNFSNFTTIPYGIIGLKDIDYEQQSSQLGDVDPSSISYQIPRAELVLIQSQKQQSDEPVKVFSTWKVEPALIDYITTRWQRQFILESNVYNACFLSPEQITDGTESMVSQIYNVASYRWSLDNIDNTNRDVPVNKGLHNDKLIDWFNNTTMKLKSLTNYNEESKFGIVPMKIYTGMDNENVYMDNKSHTLQLILNAKPNSSLPAKNVYLYKQLLKTL